MFIENINSTSRRLNTPRVQKIRLKNIYTYTQVNSKYTQPYDWVLAGHDVTESPLFRGRFYPTTIFISNYLKTYEVLNSVLLKYITGENLIKSSTKFVLQPNYRRYSSNLEIKFC